MGDVLTPQQRSYCMSRVRSKDTKLEVFIRQSLYARGLRYRKNFRALPGKPDIVFLRKKIAIFIDGDFWHGFDFEKWKGKLTPLWAKKISDNISRDVRIFSELQSEGWRVIRVWQHEIKSDLAGCTRRIEDAVRNQED